MLSRMTEGTPSTGGIAAEGLIVDHDIDMEVVQRATGGSGVIGLLGVQVHELTRDRVVMSLPVGPRTHQPTGVLHGGVSALLAESAASFGAAISAPPGYFAVGIEINASHLRSMVEGTLTAVATPARKGRTIHVWDIALADETGRAICDARCTVAIRPGADPENEASAPGA
jgi:1,4-dihydroxy-2-naphthoyl-CoA hydrolase